jgi:hypothetical protein
MSPMSTEADELYMDESIDIDFSIYDLFQLLTYLLLVNTIIQEDLVQPVKGGL